MKKLKSRPVVSVFLYTSQCCSEKAEKAPLLMPEGRGIGGFGSSPKTEGQDQGLGGWRCTGCRRPAKVNRNKRGANERAEQSVSHPRSEAAVS